MRKVTGYVLVLMMAIGGSPRLLATAGTTQSQRPMATGLQNGNSDEARNLKATFAGFEQMAKSAKNKDIRRLAGRFVRLGALLEIPTLFSRADRENALTQLGITWHSGGSDLVVTINHSVRVVKNVGAPVRREGLAVTPDGATAAVFDDEWEDWENAESEAVNTIVSIEAMEYENELILDDLYAMESWAEVLCAEPGPSVEGKGPCIDALYTAITEGLTAIGAYASNKSVVNAALSAARNAVQANIGLFTSGAIGAVAFAEAIGAGAAALVGTISVPWWAVGLAAAAVAYLVYQVSECVLSYQ